MKLKFQAPKGKRIMRYGSGVHVSGYWWDKSKRQWVAHVPKDGDFCNKVECRTVRAFRRMLKKHPHIRGKATFVSILHGHNVYG